ncbi:MAG: type II secretion system protein [Lachnospiraceae bacterium]|nr:type II secretion system protein [Lachnospiraceae bacterium]
MKKMNNKGFSLVELIIVIAIMAILAGAIAPALIRYIDKSRKSNDVSSGKTIKTAVETAMGTEDAYEQLTAAGTGSVLTIKPGETSASNGVTLTTGGSGVTADTRDEIFQNIGEKTPKIKYKKNNATNFYVLVSGKGTISVWIGSGAPGISQTGTKGTNCWQLAPELDKEYQ